MRHILLASALLLCAAVPACESDASKSKTMSGIWIWKPRAELPKDQIVEKGFVTPEMEAIELRADGTYVWVQRIPSWESDIAGERIRVPERWEERKGTWSYANGNVELGEAPVASRWGARRDPVQGWIYVVVDSGVGRTFKVVSMTKTKLQLHDLAIGGHDHYLHHTDAMPPRPQLGSGRSEP
jgi:hypothetical protein